MFENDKTAPFGRSGLSLANELRRAKKSVDQIKRVIVRRLLVTAQRVFNGRNGAEQSVRLVIDPGGKEQAG